MLFCCGYDFLINASAAGSGYYRDILDGGTNKAIGGMYQNAVFDSTGETIGTVRGFDMFFDDVDGDAGWPWKENKNSYFFLDGGDLIMLESFIITGTGEYETYTGGTLQEVVVSPDPNYVAELTLFKRDNDDGPTVDNSGNGGAVMTTFRITSAGGNFFSMTDQNNSEIGIKFQDKMLDSAGNGNVVGWNQGVDYWPSPSVNRIFQFDDGEYLLAINDAIVYGLGPYQKFQGAIVLMDTISTSPDYVANITLVIDDETEAAATNAALGGDVMLHVINDGGFYAAITDLKTGDQIGTRFQDLVFDSLTGENVGTIQGYAFHFPPSDYILGHVGNGNRHFDLKEGSMNIYNKVVVSVNGTYKKFVGGIIQETVYSVVPYNSSILLVEPSANDVNSTGVGEEPPAEIDESSTNSNGGSHMQLGCVLLIISQAILVTFHGITSL